MLQLQLQLQLPDTDEHGQLPDLHGDRLGQASRAECIKAQHQKMSSLFLMLHFLVNGGIAVSVKIRLFSVSIRVKAFDLTLLIVSCV